MEVAILGEARFFEYKEEAIGGDYLDLTALAIEDLVESRGESKDGAGDKAAAVVEKPESAGEGLPKLVVKDGKTMELVSQKYIDSFKSRPPLPPLRHHYSEEFFRNMGLSDDDVKIMLRGFQAIQDIRDEDKDILEQYYAKGYAYVPLPEANDDDVYAIDDDVYAIDDDPYAYDAYSYDDKVEV